MTCYGYDLRDVQHLITHATTLNANVTRYGPSCTQVHCLRLSQFLRLLLSRWASMSQHGRHRNGLHGHVTRYGWKGQGLSTYIETAPKTIHPDALFKDISVRALMHTDPLFKGISISQLASLKSQDGPAECAERLKNLF